MAMRKFHFDEFNIGVAVCATAVFFGFDPAYVFVYLWAMILIILASALTKWIAKKWRGGAESSKSETFWMAHDGKIRRIDDPGIDFPKTREGSIYSKKCSEAEFNQGFNRSGRDAD